MGYRLSNEAEEDMMVIAETGLRHFGESKTRQYNRDLFGLFDLIAANPRMARQRTELSPPARILPFKAHLVIYVVDDNGDVVIVRVRHGHENWIAD